MFSDTQRVFLGLEVTITFHLLENLFDNTFDTTWIESPFNGIWSQTLGSGNPGGGCSFTVGVWDLSLNAISLLIEKVIGKLGRR